MFRSRKVLQFLALFYCASISAQQTVVSAASDIESFQSLLQDLEQTFGQNDPRLAEPLYQLAGQYTAAGRYAQAHRVLDRAMLIVRREDGLYTQSQMPFLRAKIDNLASWGDWDATRQQLQHIYWFYRTKTRQIDPQLIDGLLHLSNTHLRGVAEDSYDMQAYHLRRALSANWFAMAAAEVLWGEDDEKLVPVLYSLVQHYHLQHVAVTHGGRTGYQLREVLPGSSWVRDRRDVRNYYFYTGQNLLNQIKDIYSNLEVPNQEAVALASLYLADWQVLFGYDKQALESYQLAYQELRQSEVDESLLEEYFSRPSVLPEQEFYPHLAQAMSARNDMAQGPFPSEIVTEQAALHFSEWQGGFPHVRKPVQLNGPYQSSNFALFTFNLVGVSDVARWIEERDATKFSAAQNTELVEIITDSAGEERNLLRRVERLRFRPSLSDGLPQDFTATLRYQLAINR